MIEREILLHVTAAVLLISIGFHLPPLTRRLGRRAFFLAVAGALLPLLDPLAFLLLSADRIEALTREPLFSAPLPGLLAIAAAAVLAAFLVPWGTALRMGACLAAGYLIPLALSLFTPAGVFLLAPFSPLRVAQPFFPAGHPPLLAAMFLLLILLEALPRYRRWIGAGGAFLALLYLAAAPVQYALVARMAARLAEGGSEAHVYPDGSWLAGWRIVLESPERYSLSRYTIAMNEPEEFREFLRWNDQALFLKMLGDPVVARFYYHVIRHPVVNLDRTGSQITLLMQELQDQSPLVPGPTFYLESDLGGRGRFYQLQRFN